MKKRSAKLGRVLMLVENNPYPQDPRVNREAKALMEAGYQVSVISPADKGQPLHEIVEGAHVYRYPCPPEAQGLLGYLWEYGYSLLATFLLSVVVFFRRGFDVIHSANPPDIFALVAAPYKLLGKRFIFDHHDLSPEMYYARFSGKGNPLVHKALVIFEKFTLRLSDHVIATNESYKALEMERGRMPEERITIVRNGPDLERMRLVEPDPELRQKAPNIFGYVGRIGFQDGVDYLLRACHHLVHDLHRTDFYCVIIGKGDARSAMMELCTKLGMDDYVWFTGLISDEEMIRYLSTADICVDPDPSNPFNDRSTMIKMMEFMALGKPIVAFDLPEHRFTAGEAALYVPDNNELEFARALTQLMDAPERRQAMGAFGRQRVENEIAWSYSAPQLIKAYRKTLGQTDDGRRTTDDGQQNSHGPSSVVRRRERSDPLRLRRKLQHYAHWMRRRNSRYVAARAIALMRRYGISNTKAETRIVECVHFLAERGCWPTFAVPGHVVHKNGEFCRQLQAMGVELVVHGYDHVDFTGLTQTEVRAQFNRAIEAFQRQNVGFEGFRCPYLSFTENQLKVLPPGVFHYSSNKAVWWDAVPLTSLHSATPIYSRLLKFYGAKTSEEYVSTPTTSCNLLEIPISIPDDIQLYDGLKLGEEGVTVAWAEMLRQTYKRGELFNLIFHPEAFHYCKPAFKNLLKEAGSLQPKVWVTQLRDVSDWWREKARFSINASSDASSSEGLHLQINCSPRATVLIRNVATPDGSRPWLDSYHILESRTLHLPPGPLPFVGFPPATPSDVVLFLREQGYIVETGDKAQQCAVYLDAATLSRLENYVQLIDYIEATTAPLVRFWRWPEGARSALCVSGDLDALSWRDYGSRIFS